MSKGKKEGGKWRTQDCSLSCHVMAWQLALVTQSILLFFWLCRTHFINQICVWSWSCCRVHLSLEWANTVWAGREKAIWEHNNGSEALESQGSVAERSGLEWYNGVGLFLKKSHQFPLQVLAAPSLFTMTTLWVRCLWHSEIEFRAVFSFFAYTSLLFRGFLI